MTILLHANQQDFISNKHDELYLNNQKNCCVTLNELTCDEFDMYAQKVNNDFQTFLKSHFIHHCSLHIGDNVIIGNTYIGNPNKRFLKISELLSFDKTYRIKDIIIKYDPNHGNHNVIQFFAKLDDSVAPLTLVDSLIQIID